MSFVYRKKKNGKETGNCFIRVRDYRGEWITRATTTTSKTVAKQLAAELEMKHWRIAQGLDPIPSTDTVATFGELMDWWKKEYGEKLRSDTILAFADKHLREPLGKLAVREVTPECLRGVLDGLVDELKPQSLNHLRAYVSRVFARAIERGKWTGANPAAKVKKKRIPKKLPVYLSAEEVPRMLAKIPTHRRALFALAVYTGLRMGEILALRWSSVDLKERTIRVERSGAHDDTKGSHADVIPVAKRLVPYLEQAKQDAGGSAWVFPGADGKQQPSDPPLDRMLRSALGRAGIVTGWKLSCRRKGCKHREDVAEAVDGKRCPTCGFTLWCSPVPRHVTFHQLRHTTATLLLKDGVPLAVVSKILRHSDPSITLKIYAHLDLDDMREAVDGLDLD